MMKTRYLIPILCTLLSAAGCKKDFLDKKPDKALIMPIALNDLDALLNNNLIMNIAPSIPMISSDDFTTNYVTWQSLPSAIERNSYIWAADVYEGTFVGDWNTRYQQIFYANVVLDRLNDLKPTTAEQQQYNTTKGSALFYRAMAFYHTAQLFAAPYRPQDASATAGIILKLSSDVNQKPGRSTLQASYDQILKDLLEAGQLLPNTRDHKTQPSKWAVCALLARVYQTMQQYDKASQYATSSLEISNLLLDYSTLNPTVARPFPVFAGDANKEIIFYATQPVTDLLISTATSISEDIYNSYTSNDLRKVLFCNNRGGGITTFKGNYTGSSTLFSGLSTDEVYLIRAECHARNNEVTRAMEDLNALLITRWAKNTFVPFTAQTTAEALDIILKERRKQLISRGLRWTDLKRLNQDPATATILSRNLDGTIYTLAPNDKRYALPIPQDEITSSVPQNER